MYSAASASFISEVRALQVVVSLVSVANSSMRVPTSPQDCHVLLFACCNELHTYVGHEPLTMSVLNILPGLRCLGLQRYRLWEGRQIWMRETGRRHWFLPRHLVVRKPHGPRERRQLLQGLPVHQNRSVKQLMKQHQPVSNGALHTAKIAVWTKRRRWWN